MRLDGRGVYQKSEPWRSEPYRRWVASLQCAHCGRAGPSQAAHADLGKGAGIKSSDATCFPACADSPGRQGCHSLIGATGTFTREHRRALELSYAKQTLAEAVRIGLATRLGITPPAWFEAAA